MESNMGNDTAEMSTVTLTIEDVPVEPTDDTEQFFEQVLAQAFAGHDISTGAIKAKRHSRAVDADALDTLFAELDGLLDSIYGNGYDEQVQRIDDQLGVLADEDPQSGGCD
jgi:hypothetical protein